MISNKERKTYEILFKAMRVQQRQLVREKTKMEIELRKIESEMDWLTDLLIFSQEDVGAEKEDEDVDVEVETEDEDEPEADTETGHRYPKRGNIQ